MAAEVNISSYSGSVSGGDWAPALAAAYAALPTGGTVNIDADITLKSNAGDGTIAYYKWVFQGNGGNTVTIDANGADAWTFANKHSVEWRNIVFIGRTGTSSTPDAVDVIGGGFCDWIIVTDCSFFGLVSSYSHVIFGATQGVIEKARFGGCGGPAHVRSVSTFSTSIKDVTCLDFGNYGANYYDRQTGRTAWIMAADSAPANGYVEIKNFRGDEGSGAQIIVTDYPNLLLEGAVCNVNGGGNGIVLTNVDRAKIVNAELSYTANDVPAMVLNSCNQVVVDTMRVPAGPKRIVIDAATDYTTITNSPGVLVTPATGANYSLNGVTYKGSVAQVG